MKLEDWIAETSPPDHADAARTLLEVAENGVLATLEESGHPYASIVELMPDGNDIILFLSDLASHTRNLSGDSRVSVVVRETGEREQLALARATFQGAVTKLEDRRDTLAKVWVERHPDAASYVGFSDFSFYRVEVERVRYIAGFGRMGWVEQSRWASAEADPLCTFVDDILEHMNEDHSHNVLDYAHAFTDATWATEAKMVSLDKTGFGVVVRAGDRQESLRIGFAEPKTTREEIHEAMVRLARLARAHLPEPNA